MQILHAGVVFSTSSHVSLLFLFVVFITWLVCGDVASAVGPSRYSGRLFWLTFLFMVPMGRRIQIWSHKNFQKKCPCLAGLVLLPVSAAIRRRDHTTTETTIMNTNTTKQAVRKLGIRRLNADELRTVQGGGLPPFANRYYPSCQSSAR